MKKIIIGTIAIFFTGGFLTFFVFSGVDNEDKIFALAKPLAKIKNQEKLQAGGAKLAQSKPVAILFGGDMMFDRYIRQKNDGAGYENVFGDLGKLFNGSDCVVANLEGPVTDNKSVSIGSEFGAPNNYIFTFAPSVLSMLERNNFCTVNLGNNHIGNFGRDGIMQTKNLIRSSSLHYFGDTATKGEQRFFVENVKGVKIAFVNYNQFVRNSLQNALDDIKNVKDKSDFVVVYTHWGQEYKTHSRKKEQDIAHQFVDVGADIIVGSHPHVVQENEVYKGKNIYYSLGNMIFDQYFSEEVKKGLLVKVIFDKENDKIDVEEHEVKMTTSGNTILSK